MASTTTDFWCMIWEQDVSSIVMLTKLEENGKVRTKPHARKLMWLYNKLYCYSHDIDQMP